MRIGVPREVKNHEYRVGLTPMSVRELTARGHEVLVQAGAGSGIGHDDAAYELVGARIAADAARVFGEAELIIKVKEPQLQECALLSEGQTLFTYLHLAADPKQAEALMKSGVTAISYETVTDDEGRLPLLAPMSEVAGRMSIQAGAHCLEKERGGAGKLLGGVAGVEAAEVVVLGGGIAGTNAARMAMGLGARVTVLDISVPRLSELDMTFGTSLNTVFSTRQTIEDYVQKADLLIGAVLVPGAAAPRLVSEELVGQMQKGAAIVDIAIDQGGCVATSKPTTHQDPSYIEQGVVHYCVTNMPGAVATTSTSALNNATLPFVLKLAEQGVKAALAADENLQAGLNIEGGRIVHPVVADALPTLSS